MGDSVQNCRWDSIIDDFKRRSTDWYIDDLKMETQYGFIYKSMLPRRSQSFGGSCCVKGYFNPPLLLILLNINFLEIDIEL